MVHPHAPNTDEVIMPKMVSVEAVWESVHDVEVPDDWKDGDDLPREAFNQLNSANCYLVDWSVA